MRKILLFTTALMMMPFQVRAAFDLERPGARAAGLAGAFTAVADSPETMIYNPAGLRNINNRIFFTNYGRLLTGLDDGQLAESILSYIYPTLNKGSFGLLWYQKNLFDLYQENMISFAYARAIDADKKLKVGAAVDLLMLYYLDDNALLNNEVFGDRSTLTTLSLDVGVHYTIVDRWTAGLSASNLNQPDIAISDDQANLPLELRLGTAYQWKDYLGTVDGYYKDDHFRIAAAGEAWWVDKLLGTRIGYATGDNDLSELTAGLSVNIHEASWALQLDYAFIFPLGAQGLGGTHQVSLQYRYAGALIDELEQAGLKLKHEGRQALNRGEREKALDYWEEAVEYLPEDEELATAILDLQDEIEKRSEFNIYKSQGEQYESKNDLINAQKAYRKALDIIPEDDGASEALVRVSRQLKLLSDKQMVQSKARERKARIANRKAAIEHLKLADRAVGKSRRDRQLSRYFNNELKRLDETLGLAKGAFRKRDYKEADVKSLAVLSEIERLEKRMLSKNRAVKRKAKKQSVAEPKTAETAVKKETDSVKKVPVRSTAKKTVLSKAEKHRKLRKSARGAYGRAVKLMLDIDQLKGSAYYPARYRNMKNQLAGIKASLKSQQYIKTIKSAKEMYPELESLKKACQKKEDARKAMPTTW